MSGVPHRPSIVPESSRGTGPSTLDPRRPSVQVTEGQRDEGRCPEDALNSAHRPSGARASDDSVHPDVRENDPENPAAAPSDEPTDPEDRAASEDGAGIAPALPLRKQEGFADNDAECHRTKQVAHDAAPHDRGARRARATARGRTAAELFASGMPINRIAAQLRVAPSTLFRWRESEWWPSVYRRALATVAAETESELAAGRLDAVRALRAVVAPPDGKPPTVDAAELSSAARALLSASAPPGELARQRARSELLASLTPSTRALVVAELDEPGLAEIESMTAAELRRDLGIPEPEPRKESA